MVFKKENKKLRACSYIKPVCYDSTIRPASFFFELLEKPKDKGQYSIIGGKTILGRIFQYQEKTGMNYNDILELPYITFVLGMADAPQIDYDTKIETKKPDNFGTKITDLPPDIIAQMR